MQQHARPIDPRTAETRQRLVDESLRLFAEHGFKGVSVRDIGSAAQANVAAVSYHFGSKQGLYRTIFETVLDEDEGRFRELIANVETLLARAVSDPVLLAAALDILVSGMIGRLSRAEHLRCFSVLVARELAFPGELFELLYRRRVEPVLLVLARIAGAAWGLSPDSPRVRLAANVAHGHLANLVFARPILWRQLGWDGFTPERVELLARTVSDLVCRAIGLAPSPTGVEAVVGVDL